MLVPFETYMAPPLSALLPLKLQLNIAMFECRAIIALDWMSLLPRNDDSETQTSVQPDKTSAVETNPELIFL